MCMRAACPKDKPEFNICLLAVFKDLLRTIHGASRSIPIEERKLSSFIIFIKQNCNE